MKHELTILLTSVITSNALADTWTVSASGKADFTTIQEAVDAAADYDDVLVMPGTYTSTGGEVVDMLGKQIFLHSSKGAGVTIIDGEGERRCISCTSNETPNTQIEGFTVTRGAAYDGGGLYLYYASATVASCNFVDNTQSSLGSAVGCFAGDLYISDSNFSNNESWWAGSAIFASGFVDVDSCTFSQNAASRGGAVYFCYAESYVYDCLFDSNTANGSYQLGGAIYLEHAYGGIDSTQCTNNQAKYGGAIYNDNSEMVFAFLEIHGNHATVLGGGIETFGPFPNIFMSTICGNLPEQIHGGWSDDGKNTVEDVCTPVCSSDITGDGLVNVNDLLALLSAWGEPTSPADVNSDGIVDVSDLLELIGSWGACP